MNKDKNILIFCTLIGVLIFAYYFLPVGFVRGNGAVTVSATVSQTISCSASTTTTAFGTLSISAITTSTPDVVVTMSCNHPTGGTLKVHDSGCSTSSSPGLYSVTAVHLVTSTTATLSAGTAGYGIQASTNTNGDGGTLTIDAVYDKSGESVGALVYSTSTNISASSEPISNRETVVKHKAAISGLTKAASDYADTITYSCTGN